jgi:hypothetical protein
MERQMLPTIDAGMLRFAYITKALIAEGNISRAKQYLAIAAKVYNNGNEQIRHAIAGVFVVSVSSFLEIHHCSIRNLFPETLKEAYNKSAYQGTGQQFHSFNS